MSCLRVGALLGVGSSLLQLVVKKIVGARKIHINIFKYIHINYTKAYTNIWYLLCPL
jgi:hypothetical protein